MAIQLVGGFRITSKEPIDDRLVVTGSNDRFAFDSVRVHDGLTTFTTSSKQYHILVDSSSYTTNAGWRQIFIDQSSGSFNLTGSLNILSGSLTINNGNLVGTASWATNATNAQNILPTLFEIPELGITGSGIVISSSTALPANTYNSIRIGNSELIDDYSSYFMFSVAGNGGWAFSSSINGTIATLQQNNFSFFETSSNTNFRSNATNFTVYKSQSTNNDATTAFNVNRQTGLLYSSGGASISGSVNIQNTLNVGSTIISPTITSINDSITSLTNATSSFVTNAQTSSFVQNSQTSSMLAPYVLNSQTSSFVLNSQTSSMLEPYVLTSVTSSMLEPYVLTSVTSSMLEPYVLNSQTSSFVQNSQTSSFVLNSQTSSMLEPYVLTSQTSSFVTNAQTNSLASLGVTGDAVIQGDLTVNGITTYINVDNLLVEDKFILLNSGSKGGVPNEGGIIVQTGTGSGGEAIGTALYYDQEANRWLVAKSSSVAYNDTSIGVGGTTDFIVTVSASAGAPVGSPYNFGTGNSNYSVGQMYINTTGGDIYIYA